MQLVAEFLRQVLRFFISQNLTRLVHDFEEKSNYQEVIKSKSQSDRKEYKNLQLLYHNINSINP